MPGTDILVGLFCDATDPEMEERLVRPPASNLVCFALLGNHQEGVDKVLVESDDFLLSEFRVVVPQ